jgi:hypothetical protein
MAMANEHAARWSLVVSEETDRALRAFLGSQGNKRGDMSRFVEEAVRWRMFDRTVQEVRARAAHLSDDDLQAIIDDAVTAVRAERPAPTPHSR